MQGEPTIPCPGCGSHLCAFRVREGVLGGCIACGGLWVDNGVRLQIWAGEPSDETKAIVRYVTEHVRAPADHYRTAAQHGDRACPGCGTALESATLPDPAITIDLCKKHGAFHDRHELGAVVQAYELRAAAGGEAEVRSFFRGLRHNGRERER